MRAYELRALNVALAVIIAAGWIPAAAAADLKPLETAEGWGLVVDPVGESLFRLEDGALTIKVPGQYHDLWPGKGKVNAPLVLQSVEGDFTVEVLVAEVAKADRDTVLPDMASTVSFHAGSLLIWQDSKNFVRLDRTNMNRSGQTITSCYLHVFKDGERVVELAPAVPDKPTSLRLGRKEDRLSAAYSQDGGKSWREFPAQRIELPARVKTGVSALNNTTSGNTVRFEALKIAQ